MTIKRNEYFRLAFIIISIICSFSVMFSDLFNQRMLSPAVLYCVCIFMYSFLPKDIFFSWPGMIINVTGFIRYVVMGFVEKTNAYEGTAWIVLIEILSVYSTFFVFSKLSKFRDYTESFYVEEKNANDNKMLVGISSAAVIIIAAVYITLHQELLSQFFYLSTRKNTLSYSSGFFALLISVFFLILLIKAYDLIEGIRIKSSFIKISLMLFIGVFYVNGVSITGDNISRWALLIFSVVIFFYVIKRFPNRKKIISLILILVIAVIVIYGTIAKFSLIASYENRTAIEILQNSATSQSLNAYFAGPKNINVAIHMHESGRLSFFPVKTICSDIFANFPMLNEFLCDPDVTTTNLFNYQIYNSSIARDQIIPLVGQLYNYFGIFFWVFEMALVYKALDLNFKIKKENNQLLLFCQIVGMICLSLINCLNISIMCQYLWIQILPVWLIYKTNYALKGRKVNKVYKKES